MLRFIQRLEKQYRDIPEERQKMLRLIADLITDAIRDKGSCNIVVICTHNSRRSQLAEAWLTAASQYFGLPRIHAYSGGTEATSFNIRMVVALREASFHLHSSGPITNPKYQLHALTQEDSEHVMFSKVYNDHHNPKTDFIALMVCDSADRDCPIVAGAKHRISLPYQDPKEFDDTPMESGAYTDKVAEIGREMLYLLGNVRK